MVEIPLVLVFVSSSDDEEDPTDSGASAAAGGSRLRSRVFVGDPCRKFGMSRRQIQT